MVNWIKKKKILLKLEDNQKPAFLNVWDQYQRCLDMSQKMEPEDERSFSEAYFGISYEFFLLGLIPEGLEIAKKIHKTQYKSLISSLDNEIHLAVFTVFYAHVRDDKFFKENFFFQSMEGSLELMNLEFPENPRVHFPAFIKSWQKVFGPLKVEKVMEIDSKTGQTTISNKFYK